MGGLACWRGRGRRFRELATFHLTHLVSLYKIILIYLCFYGILSFQPNKLEQIPFSYSLCCLQMTADNLTHASGFSTIHYCTPATFTNFLQEFSLKFCLCRWLPLISIVGQICSYSLLFVVGNNTVLFIFVCVRILHVDSLSTE